MSIVWKTTLPVLMLVGFFSCAAKPQRADGALDPDKAEPARSTDANTSQATPKPPSVYLDTTYVRPTGRTITVAGDKGAATGSAARNLQAALDSARPGDVILLEAGAVFIGNFTLPDKGSGSSGVRGPGSWITIRSSAPDTLLPPPGTRITPAQSSRMPKIISPDSQPALQTAPRAHHYRLIGIEFGIKEDVTLNYGIVLMGDGSQAQKSLSAVPHDLVIDRCYIHGNPKADVSRGLALNSASTSIIDSYISEIHGDGFDTQAIAGWNGPGPYKIVNNYLEAAGENVMFGGADPFIPQLVPSDIEFRRNHCFKPLAWKKGERSFGGREWTVKNLFELKNARRVLVDGNILENNWAHAQDGFAIVLTPRNQDGTAPWSVVEDVDFTNNIVRHTACGINVLGRDNLQPSQQMKRCRIKNNLFDDVGGARWNTENGLFLQITETVDMRIENNTVIHMGNIITAYGAPNTGFVFVNNLMPHNEYGVFGDHVGKLALDRYFPGYIFKKNVIVGGPSSDYPADNYFPKTLKDVGFIDRANRNYALSGASPYKNAGTDRKDIGCNIDALKGSAGPIPPERPSALIPIDNLGPQARCELIDEAACGLVARATSPGPGILQRKGC